ncbi:MAG: hypothetical protein R2778_01295 [Saprospiraceae bacterium]
MRHGYSNDVGRNLSNLSSFCTGTSRWEHIERADEYDRSFLPSAPSDCRNQIRLDADHLDIYGSEAEVRASYAQFSYS